MPSAGSPVFLIGEPIKTRSLGITLHARPRIRTDGGRTRPAVTDMFWDQPFDAAAMKQWCWDTWRVVPRPLWAQINWGGRHIETASNIVFSNGRLDPWSSGGVLEVLV